MKNFLHKASGELVEKINKFAFSKTFTESSMIFSEGEKAEFLPIIVSGKVKMVRFPEAGKEVIIGIFQNGDIFALPPVFDGKAYPSTGIAMEKTELLILRREDFLYLLRESNEFSFTVIGWLCEMLREKTAMINNLATASPEHRVVNVLLRLCERENIEMPLKITLRRQDIAEMAGLTTETTIRAVKKLAERNLLEIVHGKIILHKIEALKNYAAI